MYFDFYGLKSNPFSLLPDADFLFLSGRHRRAVNILNYGLASQAGFVVISGDVGAGKTTIIRRFLRGQRDSTLCVGVVNNATAAAGGLMHWISMAFELPQAGRDHISLYNQLLEFVLARYAEGKRVLLIVDEAQNLSTAMLEDLRMLSNINNEKDLMLQVVLLGQPELLETLKNPNLRQFAQRISVHYHLGPISREETRAYIHHRLTVAGGRPALFDDLACEAVYHFTGGVPRLINLLCDQALLYAFAEAMPSVTFDLVVDAAHDRESGGLTPFLPAAGLDRAALQAALDAAHAVAETSVPPAAPAQDAA